MGKLEGTWEWGGATFWRDADGVLHRYNPDDYNGNQINDTHIDIEKGLLREHRDALRRQPGPCDKPTLRV